MSQYVKLKELLVGLFLISLPILLYGQSDYSIFVQEAEIALKENNLTKVKKLLERELSTHSSTHRIDSLLISSKYQFAIGDYLVAKSTSNYISNLARHEPDSTYLFKALSWQGFVSTEWHDLQKADSILINAGKLSTKWAKSKSLIYKEWQYHLGLLYIAQHKYQSADSIFTTLLSNQNLKTQSIDLYYRINYQLGESKNEQELFNQADSILNRIQLEIEKEKGVNYFLKIFTLNHLSRVYLEIEKYQKGLDAYEEAFSIASKNNINNKHPVYGKLLSNYGQLLLRMGSYQLAEETLLKAEEIYFKIFQATPNYAFVIARLEDLYRKLGQTDKELAYAKKQKNIFKDSGRYSDYARTLNNLSTIYVEQKKYTEANQLFSEGIQLLKENNQTETSLYAALIMNYAALNIDLGNYQLSQKLSEEARTILSKVFGKKHPWYASVINNLAYLYKTTGAFQKAKTYYLETETIDGETLGKRHPYYIGTTYSLAGISELTTEIDSAYHYYKRANTGQVNLIYNYYSGFDEAVRLSYLTTTEADFYQFLSFVLRHQETIPTLSKDAQNLNLAIKNLALDFSKDNQALANQIKDSTTAKIYQDWLDSKKQLSQSYTQSPEEQAAAGTDLEALELKTELLEKELVRSEVLSSAKLALQERTTFDHLKTAIQPEEAVIDFLRFPYYLPDRQTDSVYYCALINRKDFEQPQMVWLGEEKQLKRLLRSNVRLNGGNYVENERIGQDLYQQIWQPLSPYLKGVKKIGISASGLIHKVSFAALPIGDKQLLDHYNFTYYGNLRAFGKTSKNSNTQQCISLFGGANFNLDSMQLSQIAQQYKRDSLVEAFPISTIKTKATDTSTTRSAVIFNYLQGTKKEVERIAKQFQARKWQAQSFIATNALEENFKILTGLKAPSILHIATHGYFYGPLKEGRKVPDNTRGRIMSAKNPLLRSGLALSGANYSWKLGKRIPNLEDGILTAYEIANQNLGNTNLVVLSACETGLGDVVNGEGVFGLQRAFKMAGVKNLLISLWKVPDQQTQELMTTFYQYYLQSNDASNALHQAQLDISKKYRPFYWAGFILAK